MSIFTETFQNFVFNQLKIREAALNQKSGRSLGAPKVEGLKGPNSEETNVTLPPGAFHTLTTSKQCIIRMSSGVDLKSENDLLDKSDIGKENLVGEGLAIRYMLEGGVPAKDVDFLNNRKEGKSEIKVIPRGRGTRQFTKGSGKDYGSAYGDPYIRSNAGDDFGIVPMPGIIDAQIRTKTAYGSLRDAQINFVCHNRRQLDILETLYMRPGMPILLEWGWSTYINNKGIRENYFPYLWEWFDRNQTINNINKIIHDRIEKSSGNYDGFVGYVKNFEIVSRPDGGYDCTTELAAMGEVIEGITGKSEGLTLKETNGNIDIEVDNLEYFLQALLQFCENRSFIESETKGGVGSIKQITPSIYSLLTNIESKIIPILNKNYSDSFFESNRKEFIKKETKNKRVTNTRGSKTIEVTTEKDFTLTKSERDNSGKKFINALDKIEKILDPYLIYKTEKLGVDEKSEETNTKSSHHYVRWDLLCDVINNLVINTYQTAETSEPITQLSYRKEIPVGGGNDNTYLQYSKFDFLKESVSFERPSGLVVQTNISNLLDMSVDPKVCLLPHQLNGLISVNNSFTKDKIFKLGKNPSNRNIGHIFIGLEYLIGRFKKLRYKGDEIIEDFNLLTFLQTIWEKDINNACGGTHNFLVSTEKTSGDIIRIIDTTKGPEPNLTPTNLYPFKTHGNNSIVRDFNYNTTIDSKLSSTVAIAAQSPNSISSLDAVSFAAFNRNIQNRFFRESNEGISDDAKAKKAEAYDKEIENVKKMLGYLYDYKVEMLQGNHEKNINTALSFIKNLESKITSLKTQYSKTIGENYKGYPRKKANLSKSTIIPLKFNCQIDGIGGLIIGNVFKVDKTFLPKGYEQDDIAFAVMTENQSITAGQDWVTEFSGQVILLDLGKENRKDNEDLLIDIDRSPSQYNLIKSKDPSVQENIDPRLNDLNENDNIYLKLDNEDTNIRSGASSEFSTNIVGIIPSGNKESINQNGLGTILNKKINPESSFLDKYERGDILSDEVKSLIGYQESGDFILINEKSFDRNETSKSNKPINSRKAPVYKSVGNKVYLPKDIKIFYFKNIRRETWYNIEFNDPSINIINIKDTRNTNTLSTTQTGWMRADVLQSFK